MESAKIREINESDTVVLLIGILSDILGYDKYTEVTTGKPLIMQLALELNILELKVN